MAEPATSTAAVIASALGLTVFGVATGLPLRRLSRPIPGRGHRLRAMDG
jgi:hypothetical protein